MTIPVVSTLSRRRFLSGASALGLAGLAPSRFISRAYGRQCPPDTKDDWKSLKKELHGQLLLPEDSRFPSFAAPFNLAYENRKPGAIVLCANRADVETAVKWAADNKAIWAADDTNRSGIDERKRIVVRAGGHSYAGYSSDRGLMIDVSLLKRYSWDSTRTKLTVECGARNGDVYTVLRAENRTLTHGRCPTVGLAGFLLGGGIGFNMRLHGVASDRVLASTLVTASGETLQLSAEENDDLFWACRGGGGGNFGINTSFTLDTVPADDRITVFKLQWTLPRDTAKTVVAKLMATLDSGDARLGSRFKFSRDESNPCIPLDARPVTIDLIGQLHGDLREVKALLRPFLADPRLVANKAMDIEEMAYWEGQDALLDWDGPFRFTERSAFIEENLNEDKVGEALDLLWKVQPSSDDAFASDNPADVRFFQTGGRMNDVGAADTAFVHRSSRWLMDFGLPWSATESEAWVAENKIRLNEMFEAMSMNIAKGSYQNFADSALSNWAQAYYGQNYDRLTYIKYKYDKENFFHFEQGIPPVRPPATPVPPEVVHSGGG